jgi:hypothetical protein
MAKFLKLVSGVMSEESTVGTSAGAGDAGKVPHLNGSGVLDPTIMNAVNTSTGAPDAGKVVRLNGSGVLAASIINSVTSSSGAGDSGKIPALDGSGRLDSTFLPVGVGADTASIQASEALSAGDFVNVHNSGGARIRKADASSGFQAHGFVSAAVSNGAMGTVYFDSANTNLSGMTPGAPQYLGTTGARTETAPSTAGHISQYIGVATSATSMSFEPARPITLAA